MANILRVCKTFLKSFKGKQTKVCDLVSANFGTRNKKILRAGSIWLFFLVLSVFLSLPVEASVCFIGNEEGCSPNKMAFNDSDQLEYNDNACQDAGYGVNISDGSRCNETEEFTYICPFNAKWVKCCGRKYKDKSCSYPRKAEGDSCGGKYYCICPASLFPYNNEKSGGVSRTNCTNNSESGGEYCTQEMDNSGTTEGYASQCVCSGAYLYKKDSECGINKIINKQSEFCINSDNVTYYSGCMCPPSWNICSKMGPATGAKSCNHEGFTYYSNCCQCDGYELNYNDPNATAYESCECNGSYQRAAACQDGYKVENGKCVPLTCEDAVKQYIAINGSYALFDGTNLLDADGIPTKGSNAIIADDITVVGGSCDTENSKYRKCTSFCCRWTEKVRKSGTSFADDDDSDTDYEESIELMEDTTCKSVAYDGAETGLEPTDCFNDEYYCNAVTDATSKISYGNIGCTTATNYVSGAYLASTLSATSNAIKAMKAACTKTPTMTFKGSRFPNSSDIASAKTISIKDVDIKFTGSSQTDSKLTLSLTNSSLSYPDSSTLTLYGPTTLSMTTNVSGSEDLSMVGGTLNIRNRFSSYGYSFDLKNVNSNLGISIPIFFEGRSSKDTFRVSDKLTVNGIVGFKNFDVYAHNTIIGSTTTRSGISLYYTNWWLYDKEKTQANTVAMTSMAYLGTPKSCENGAFNSSIGSSIVFLLNNAYSYYYALALRDGLYNGEDNNNPKEHVVSVPYVTSAGASGYYYCTNKGVNLLAAGKGHHSSTTRVTYTWTGNSSKLTEDWKHGCKACAYQK